jgi:hypothetical protein
LIEGLTAKNAKKRKEEKKRESKSLTAKNAERRREKKGEISRILKSVSNPPESCENL